MKTPSARPSHPSVPLRTMASAVAIASAMVATPTLAASLEEVMVTATKRTESIQDVPVSVTSLGKELKEASLRRLDDIQSFTPNVYLRNHPSAPGGLSIAIRGVSSDEYDKSFDPAIGVIMDGLVLGTASGSMLQNFDTKRIEVLRGPQGTLFGKNTTGGVVNVIRGDVTQEFGLDTGFTIGQDGRRDVKAVLNLPVVEETLGVKLFGASIQSDGYLQNITVNKDVGGDDLGSFGFATLWTPSEDVSIKLHLERLSDKSDTGNFANGNINAPEGSRLGVTDGSLAGLLGGSPPDGSDENHTTGARVGKNDSETDIAILTVNWDLDDFLLTYIGGYQDKDEHYLNNFDPSPVDFLYLDYFNKWEQQSHELRLTSNFSEEFEFIAGLYYWDVDYVQFWDVGRLHYNLDQIGAIVEGVPGGAGFTEDTLATNGQAQQTESIAAFFSGDWHITDQVTLTAGIRWTEEEKKFSGGDGSLFYDPNVMSRPDISVNYRDFEDKWNEISPKVGVRYQPSDDIMVFATYTEGFKSGGFFGRQANFTDVDVKYDPEYVKSYELGLKSEWLDGRLIVNPTIFLNKFEDKQESFLFGIDATNVATVVANASSVDIFGAELELLFQATEEWNLRASYGYIDAEYDNFFADINGDLVATDNSGLPLRNTPENSFGLTSTYILPCADGDLAFMGSYRWRDKIVTLLDHPLSEMDSIENFDATISYGWGDETRFRVSAFGRNLTDEREARFAEIAGLTGFYTWNAPRSFGVEFNISM